MNRAPAFQFYAAEYLADESVQLLTLEQEGIYIRLLAYCWREGSIPADAGKVSRLCKNAPPEALADVLSLFTEGEDGRLIHARLEAERRKHEEFRASCAERGKAGAEKRWLKDGSAIAEPLANDGFSSSSSSSNCKLPTENQTTNTFALTPSGIHAPAGFIGLPLNDGSLFQVSETQIASWEELYPAIDVRQQVRNYKGHFDADPTKRKTKSGILKSVTHWLANAQNNSKGRGVTTYGSNRNQDRSDGLTEAARGAFDSIVGRTGAVGGSQADVSVPTNLRYLR